MKIKYLFLIAIMLASGCVSAPPTVDPFEGMKISNPVYKDLTLAVVVSKNTKNTIEYARSAAVRRSRGTFGPKIEQYISDFSSAFLQKTFKAAVKVENIEDAGAINADLVAILDVTAEGGIHAGQATTVNIALIFMTRDERQIDVVKGSGTQTIAFPDFSSAFDAAVQDSISQAQHAFENSLFNSSPLIAFAKSKQNGQGITVVGRAQSSVIISDIDSIPSSKIQLNKKAYAIVIGIEQYRQKLPIADFAFQDAKLVTEYLTKVMGYPEENVVTLTNDRAAKSDFEKYFDKWLPNNVEPGSTVFVYYSGHGAPNPKTSDAYLVPYDGDPSFIDETGYSLKRMYAALGKLPAKEVIVALDSCFSGAGGRSVIAKGSRPLVMNLQNNIVLPKNMTVLSASAGDQTSSTYDEKGHGLFTYFMLKGIKNEDVVRPDGSLNIDDLYGYIKLQVERIARKQYNNEQTPQLIEQSRRERD